MAGDLNLKKAWHPSTRSNLEKVYLAEKEAEEEQKQIQQLKEEKRQEQEKKYLRELREKAGLSLPKSDRLDWMYQATDTRDIKSSESYSAPKNIIGSQDKGPSGSEKETKLRRCDNWSKAKEDPMFK